MDAHAIIYGVIGAAGGAALLLFPDKFASKATSNHAKRIAELESGAPEAYFEELRERRAYPPPSRPATVRLMGGISLILGFGLIALYFL